ncbi:MAG: helix-turn-helix domain-containing protein, partial [Hyphomicrobiales bacterium]
MTATLDTPEITASDAYRYVERAIEFIASAAPEQPSLAEVAAHVGLSEWHLQRVFTRWAGVSPKRFLQYLTLADAKDRLRESRPVLEAALESGLSSPSRLHELFVTYEAVTPGEYRRRGEGVVLRYGVHDTPFGPAVIVASERGVTGLGFVGESGEEPTLRELLRGWERAEVVHDAAATAPLIGQAFGQGEKPGLVLRGSPFQLKVWEALLRIPEGHTWTYRDVARAVGAEGGSRAVGQAIGANPVA